MNNYPSGLPETWSNGQLQKAAVDVMPLLLKTWEITGEQRILDFDGFLGSLGVPSEVVAGALTNASVRGHTVSGDGGSTRLSNDPETRELLEAEVYEIPGHQIRSEDLPRIIRAWQHAQRRTS